MAKVRNQNYDIALNGQGYILENKPEQPLITVNQEPNFLPRVAQGDRSYTDLSQYWYWTQIDFSGGIQEFGLWRDNTQYHEGGKNIDPYTTPGNVIIAKNPVVSASVFTNAAYLTIGTFGQVGLADSSTVETAFYVGTKATTIDISNGARLYKSLDQGVTWTSVGTIVNTTAICDMFIAGKATGGSASILWCIFPEKIASWNANSFIDLTTNFTGSVSTNFTVGAFLGDTLYIWGGKGNIPKLVKSTDMGSTSSVVQTYPGGTAVYDAKNFNGKIYYLLSRGAYNVELRTFDGISDVLVKTFPGLDTPSGLGTTYRYNRSLVVSPGGEALLMALTDGTKIFVYSIDTNNNILLRYRDIAKTLYISGQMWVVNSNNAYYGNLVVSDYGNGNLFFHNGFRNADNDGFFIPIASSGTNTVFVTGIGQTNQNKAYTTSGANYYSTGIIISNEFGVVSGLDKVFNSVIVTFKKLAAGESILFEYSTDGGLTYTTIDTVSNSNDGGTIIAKKIFFPPSTITKRMIIRVTLTAGTGQLTTPTFQTFTVQYLPIPDYKQRWRFTIKCIDEIQRKDYSKEPKDALWLRNTLRNSWWQKAVLDFEGYDSAAQELLSGTLGLTDTTITVQGTTDFFPEIGRILIGSEEILYSGKTKNQFLSCTRGARNSVAATHNNGDNISVIYKVLISEYSESLILANNPIKPEYRVTLDLKEV